MADEKEKCGSLACPSPNSRVEAANSRCRSLHEQIQTLPQSKIQDSCKRTLLKLVDSELRFLSHLSFTPHFSSSPLSLNVGHLESVVHILQQPFISAVSRVCKPLLTFQKKGNPCSKGAHVDIVCTVDKNPVWFIISDRNPRYITWLGSHRNKGLRKRVEEILAAAHSKLTLKPSSIILFFSNGLDEVLVQKLRDEFGASDFDIAFSLDFNTFSEVEDWVYVIARGKPSALQINVDHIEKKVSSPDHGVRSPFMGATESDLSGELGGFGSNDAFSSLILAMRSTIMDSVAAKPEAVLGENLINFDTTALVALVSGISNGGAEQLLKTTETEMRKRFKNNVGFVMAQAISELQNPIMSSLRGIISGKRGIICESVHSEFKELISMYGGPGEKSRAEQLLNCVLVVPDTPSERLASLPTTRKIALKNKIIFGTGDHWRAPSLTANIGFVRAIAQTGMSLLTLEHRPCALIGD